MLKQKQSISNDEWLKAFPLIKNLISEQEVRKIEEQTLADIKAKTEGKKTAYAYSGGKDSIVLSALAQKAGITDCMIGICNLEYPAFLKWINANKPPSLEIINTGQDMAWLAAHPEMLFPGTQGKAANVAAKWFAIVQHKAQAQYFKARNLDILLMGRRRAEGNYIGRGTNIYTAANGITRFSPIAYWTHEQILGYIAYNELPLPPIYEWVNGFKYGTHPWAARWSDKAQTAWSEIYSIDPAIVEQAAYHFESAQSFLKGLKA